MNRLFAKFRVSSKKILDYRMIFVIGCGRSGTHWVGYTLQEHPDIHVSIEKPPIFNLVTSISLDLTKKNRLFPKLIKAYASECAAVAPLLYADKSHPNIWLAEDLVSVFPKAQFIGIKRNPYATVASMLKHRGILKWFERWKEFPIPNQFLGITNSNASEYEQLPSATKCALRWKVHAERMASLQTRLGPKLHVIQYEDLINETSGELSKLNKFLALASPIPVPKVKRESLDRWRAELSSETLDQIKQIVNRSY